MSEAGGVATGPANRVMSNDPVPTAPGADTLGCATSNCFRAKVHSLMWKFAHPNKHPIREAHWPTAEEAARSLLFQPIDIGSIALEIRTWVPARVPWRAAEAGEVPSES